MGGRSKMEMTEYEQFMNDGYLYAPQLIIDPSNLYCPPPKDEKGNLAYGTIGYRNGKVISEPVDEQVPTSYSRYGHPPFQYIHELVRKSLENILEMDLFPTYYFDRFYWKDSILTRHVDRPACEISVSIQISSNTNPWPFCFKKPDGTETSVTMKDGDGVIYRGCDTEHWRDKLQSRYNKIQRAYLKYRKKDDDTYHHQIFFHFVNAQGNYVQHAFDR